MMKLSILNILPLIAVAIFSTTAQAVPVLTNSYSVSNAAGNCAGGDHGLWTNTLNAGNSSCNDYYSFQADSIFQEFDDNGVKFAVLTATAINPDNILATINIVFGDYSTTQSPIKNPYNVDISDWHYYQSITSSNINILGDDYSLTMAGNYSLQVGIGANDKSATDFGGSVWVESTGGNYTGNHWDLNMVFTATTVPAPSIFLLLMTGLFGIPLFSRRKK